MAHVSEFDGFIFDYGGVLVSHQTDADRAKMAAIAKMESYAFDKAYWGERTEYDRGMITADQYWTAIAGTTGGTLSQEQIEALTEADSVSWMGYDPAMWEWVDELRRAGKRVAILSNMPFDLGEALKARTDRLTVFDHVTLSYELRVVKPDPVIYEECLEGLGTAPGKTLFLDDRIENITGAEAVGVVGVQFTSREDVFLRLRS